MPGRFCVTLTVAKNDADRATVALVIANAAQSSEKETVLFLTVDGVRLAIRGYADDIHEAGFAPARDLLANFAAAGGQIWVCSPCFRKRALDETKLIPGATLVGGARLVEFVSEGCPTVSY